MVALQCIFVDRTNPHSRVATKAAIRGRALDLKFPHVMLFPEGTVTNQSAVIRFKTGAFEPGLPVQPVRKGKERKGKERGECSLKSVAVSLVVFLQHKLTVCCVCIFRLRFESRFIILIHVGWMLVLV
jgi:hypothetical protein